MIGIDCQNFVVLQEENGGHPFDWRRITYAIKRVQVNQDGLKLNGTHQLLAYADDVNILGGSAHTVKENAEALLVVT